MLLKRLFALAGLVSGLAVPAFAQGAAEAGRATTVTLTLDEPVNRALAQGEEMQTARAQYRDAQGQVREAMAGALPQVNGSLTYSRQFASIFQSLGSGTDSDTGITSLFKNSPFGAANSWNASITASQLLFSAGKVGARLKAAKAFRTGTDAQQRGTAADAACRRGQRVLGGEAVGQGHRQVDLSIPVATEPGIEGQDLLRERLFREGRLDRETGPTIRLGTPENLPADLHVRLGGGQRGPLDFRRERPIHHGGNGAVRRGEWSAEGHVLIYGDVDQPFQLKDRQVEVSLGLHDDRLLIGRVHLRPQQIVLGAGAGPLE